MAKRVFAVIAFADNANVVQVCFIAGSIFAGAHIHPSHSKGPSQPISVSTCRVFPGRGSCLCTGLNTAASARLRYYRLRVIRSRVDFRTHALATSRTSGWCALRERCGALRARALSIDSLSTYTQCHPQLDDADDNTTDHKTHGRHRIDGRM